MLYGSGLLSMPCAGNPSALWGKMQTEAQRENAILFETLFNHFSNIAVTRFDWRNLPQTVSERFLNEALYLLGQACFFSDPETGYMSLPCTFGSEFNAYYEPIAVEAYSINYYRRLGKGEFVFIRNNPTCTPTALPVYEYTRRMADTLRTIDVLCKKMKQPYIILCDEKEKQTYLNLIKQVSDNEILILGSKSYGLKNSTLELVETKVDTDLAKLWDTYRNYENLLYTALGINSVGQEKRERLLVDEVNSNNMVIQMSTDVNLKELQTACEKINKMYGLDVWVEAKGLESYTEGVGPSGEVYDNPTGTAETRV